MTYSNSVGIVFTDKINCNIQLWSMVDRYYTASNGVESKLHLIVSKSRIMR